MRGARLAAIALALAALVAGPASSDDAAAPETRVFTASRIVTMDAATPAASAVAVREGRIVAVGSADELRSTLGDEAVWDERFADRVLVPGLIDNHLHPSMAALLLPMAFVTPYDWRLPGRTVEGVRGREAYLARVRELHAGLPDARWLFTWGWHELFHGPLTRADLDAISSTRPIVVWQRSFHEIVVNSAALAEMALPPEAAAIPQADVENGHFFETGLDVAFGALAPRLLEPKRFAGGLATMREMVHRGGITTVADMATGIFDLETELAFLTKVLGDETTPFRTLLVPDARALGSKLGRAEALAAIESLEIPPSPRIALLRQVKLFADGAFYSQLMQLGPPGYLDGHHGEWLMQPAELEAEARRYWNAGFQLHVHVNGDLGVEKTLDVLETLLREQPRDDHRFTLHHFGYSTDAQSKRIAALGAHVSANPYYLYTLGDAYAEQGLGPERAAHMVRLGSLVRAGVPVSLHSDLTMAPAEPLRLAWVAANRVTANGTQLAPGERLDREQALRAITIDAARAIRMEHEIGSIAVGKRADFTVLDRDPTGIPAAEWAELQVIATVLEGRAYPIARAAEGHSSPAASAAE